MITLKALSEKRRNPAQNPTTSAYEKLEKYKDDPDIYISFTDLPKLGINPNNEYNTPTAVYTYPLKQVWRKFKKKKAELGAFTDGRPYIQVLRQTGGKFIEDISKSYTSSDLAKDEDKLRKLYPPDKSSVKRLEKSIKEFEDGMDTLEKSTNEVFDRLSKYTNISEQKSEFDSGMIRMRADYDKFGLDDFRTRLSLEENSNVGRVLIRLRQLNNIFMKEEGFDLTNKKITWAKATRKILFNASSNYREEKINDRSVEWSIEYGKRTAQNKTAGGMIWNITRLVANGNKDEGGKNAVVHWNKVFRSLGYSGIADKSGAGIIHPAEKFQAIFFSIKAFKHVEMILNKTHRKALIVKKFDDYIEPALNYWMIKPRSVSQISRDLLHNSTIEIKNKKEFYGIVADDMVKNFERWDKDNTISYMTHVIPIVFKYAKNYKPLLKNKKFMSILRQSLVMGKFPTQDIKAWKITKKDFEKMNKMLKKENIFQ